MIQLGRLEGFYWVSRTGGYSRAAREMPYPITQPAVHQQVRKLERELGVKLFERVGRGSMKLTPAGRTLYSFVEPFFSGLPAVERALTRSDHGGALVIYAAALSLRHLLPTWLRRLQLRLPDLEITLQELVDPDVSVLRRGQADLLVDWFPEVPADLGSRHVADLQAYIVLPTDHRLAARKRIPLADLRGETFVGYHPDLLPHGMQMKVLEDHDAHPARQIHAGNAETILGFVASGLGFSIIPALQPELLAGRGVAAFPLGGRRTRFPIHALWRPDSLDPFLEAILETAPRP